MNSIIDQQRELVWIDDPEFWDYYNEVGRDLWCIPDEDLSEPSLREIVKDTWSFDWWRLGNAAHELTEALKNTTIKRFGA